MNIIKRVLKADIIQVFSFTSLSTLVRMLTGMVSVKIVSSIIGPSGVAILGQLNNFISIIQTLSAGGINSGVTKYVAEYKEDKDYLTHYLSTALRITFFCSVAVGLFMIVCSRLLSITIMKSEEYQYVFFIFGFTAIFYALNNLLTSIVNGFKEYKLYVKISIANTLFGLVFTVTLVTSLGLKGALIGAVTFQSVMIFITLWLLRKAHWLKWENFKSRCKRYAVNRYFRYSLMALTSAAVVPVSQIFLRGYVISEISAVEAGWWEAMNRVSSTYLSIITSSFGVYYLPKLSETKDNLSLHHEIMKAYKVIVPVLIVGLILVYMFRRLVITILFSPAFYPMENLFIWQEIGDFFKIMSWLLAYLMLAKAKTILFISSEILSSLLFVLLGLFFIHFYGVIGLTQAYMGHYLIYFIVMVIAFRNIIFVKFRKRDYDC